MQSFIFDASLSPEVVRLLEATLKASAVLILTYGILGLFRKGGHSSKHLVWCVAFAGIVSLPVLSQVLPTWEILPAFDTTAAAPAVEASQATSQAAPVVTESNAIATVPQSTETGTASSANRNPVVEAVSSGYQYLLSLPLSTLILLIWGAGTLGVVLHMFVGFVAVRSLAFRATEVSDSNWMDLSDEVGDRLFLKRSVRLMKIDSIQTPITWGGLRPVVLLPTIADSWSNEKKLSVLTHEYAHVLRWDTLFHTVARLACGIYWFNPLVWNAAKRQREEREFACDQIVLASGTSASDYAEYLIEIARTFKSGQKHPFGVLSMAKPSQLEGRVLSVLDDSETVRAREKSSSWMPLAAVTVSLLLTAAIAVESPKDSNANDRSGIEAAIASNADSELSQSAQMPPASQSVALPSIPDSAPQNALTVPSLESLESLESQGSVAAADTLDKRKELEDALIEALLNDRNTGIRKRAAGILGDLQVLRATNALASALDNDRSEDVRMEAASSLARMDDDEAYKELLNALKNENDSDVREHILALMSDVDQGNRFAEIGRDVDDRESSRDRKTLREVERERSDNNRSDFSDHRRDRDTHVELNGLDEDIAIFLTDLTNLGLQLADETLEEVSQALNDVEWDEIANDIAETTSREINAIEWEDMIEEIVESVSEGIRDIEWEEITEELAEDISIEIDMTTNEFQLEIEYALIDELVLVIEKNPDSRRGRRARRALEDMDTKASRRALRRLARNP